MCGGISKHGHRVPGAGIGGRGSCAVERWAVWGLRNEEGGEGLHRGGWGFVARNGELGEEWGVGGGLRVGDVAGRSAPRGGRSGGTSLSGERLRGGGGVLLGRWGGGVWGILGPSTESQV